MPRTRRHRPRRTHPGPRERPDRPGHPPDPRTRTSGARARLHRRRRRTAGRSRRHRLDPSGWKAPSELPIHTEILRSRPEVTAVVHAHPPAVVAASVADLPWLPLVGSYDIPAARLAHDGIPVWPRSALIRRRDLAEKMADCLEDRPVVVLRGHGLVAVGTGDPAHAVAEAVTRALAVDSLARATLTVAATGAPLRPIPDEDIDELPDLGPAFNVSAMWRHLAARTEHEGPDTPLRP
ncbi:class II aldolase/adducin family protein [Streptomyces chiangmaiensis]